MSPIGAGKLGAGRGDGGLVGRRAESSDALRTAVIELTAAIDEGADYLPGDEVLAVEKVLKKAAERLTLSGRHTVVALASGPHSLTLPTGMTYHKNDSVMSDNAWA